MLVLLTALQMGFRSEKGSKRVNEMCAVIAFDRDDRATCEGFNLQVANQAVTSGINIGLAIHRGATSRGPNCAGS